MVKVSAEHRVSSDRPRRRRTKQETSFPARCGPLQLAAMGAGDRQRIGMVCLTSVPLCIARRTVSRTSLHFPAQKSTSVLLSTCNGAGPQHAAAFPFRAYRPPTPHLHQLARPFPTQPAVSTLSVAVEPSSRSCNQRGTPSFAEQCISSEEHHRIAAETVKPDEQPLDQ